MIITLIPVLTGSGISLFGPLERDLDLELIRAEPFGGGLLQAHYRVKGASFSRGRGPRPSPAPD